MVSLFTTQLSYGQACGGSWDTNNQVTAGCVTNGQHIGSTTPADTNPCVGDPTPSYTAAQTNTFTFTSPVSSFSFDFIGFSGFSGCKKLEVKINGVHYNLTSANLSDAGCVGYSYITVNANGYITTQNATTWSAGGGARVTITGVNATSVTISTDDSGGTLVSDPFNCTPICSAGNNAPALTATTNFTSNTYTIPCGSSTANLSSITASNNPGTLPITYHSGTPATDANKLSSITALAVGTYYAAFYNATGGCYSPTTAVTVTKANCMVANNDSGSSFNVTTGTTATTASVIANDTNNGSAVTLGASGNSTLTWQSTAPAGITLNADGTVSVASTTAAGTYNLTYQICDKVVPTNCNTGTVSVVISAAATCNAGTVAPTVN